LPPGCGRFVGAFERDRQCGVRKAMLAGHRHGRARLDPFGRKKTIGFASENSQSQGAMKRVSRPK
jgi:hypothetical protein